MITKSFHLVPLHVINDWIERHLGREHTLKTYKIHSFALTSFASDNDILYSAILIYEHVK